MYNTSHEKERSHRPQWFLSLPQVPYLINFLKVWVKGGGWTYKKRRTIGVRQEALRKTIRAV
jgi:hypothetical protein